MKTLSRTLLPQTLLSREARILPRKPLRRSLEAGLKARRRPLVTRRRSETRLKALEARLRAGRRSLEARLETGLKPRLKSRRRSLEARLVTRRRSLKAPARIVAGRALVAVLGHASLPQRRQRQPD